MDSGIGSHDDIFLQPCSAAVVKKGIKFQPKSISQPKERKAKSVSFILPDAGEIAAPIETDFTVLEHHLNGANPSSVQMLTNEFSDKIPHTTSNNADFQMDDSRLGTQDLADLSGLEFFDSILPEPTLVTDQDTCHTNTESLEENVNLKSTDPILERNINIVTKRKPSEISEDIDNEIHPLNVEEQTVQFKSMDCEDQGDCEDLGASKSSKNLRKRIDVGSPGQLDGGNNEDQVIENDCTQLAEDHDEENDDEYWGENTPKKAAAKKSKKLKTEAQRPAQKRKVSKEPDSTKNEPPKKRFPHGTRRQRRQVDKALLEIPDYEINPKQLKIRDLIMLAEAKERISSKEAAAPRNNQSYGEDHEIDEDEEHRNRLRSSPKLNYHTHMKKRQTGRWSKSETESFYEALRQFGTDFAMIQQLFPNRTRHQVKLKFKNEERKNPLAIGDAITHRSKDHSHFERVIQQLKAIAEEESRHHEENGDPTIESQDAVNQNKEERLEPKKDDLESKPDEENGDPTIGSEDADNQNEEERRESEKEDLEANGLDGEADNTEKYNEWDEEYDWDGDGTSDYKGYDDFE